MSLRLPTIATLLVAGLAFCAVDANAQNRATTGAVIGGAAGAAIGGAATGTTGGAVAGAVVGGVTGAAIGNNRSRRVRSGHFWRNGRCYFRYSNGRVVRSPNSHCRR